MIEIKDDLMWRIVNVLKEIGMYVAQQMEHPQLFISSRSDDNFVEAETIQMWL